MKRKIGAGSTSVELPIMIYDSSSSTGAGLGSLVFNTASLVAEYRRKGSSSWTAITLTTATLGTWTSGGFIADGSLTGAYALYPPDACFAAGQPWVVIRLRGAANMLPVLIEVELDAVNYQDATAFGLSRLDAAITTRMATYTQPTGFLAATFPGTIASTTNITAASGVTLASGTQTFNMTGSITGNLSGSVGSVTGAVGSVTGSVGSVTGAVGSVTDKSGFLLAAAGMDSVVIETGVNARQALSLISAAAAGVISGSPDGPIVIKGLNVATTRITATIDADGNRTAITPSLPT